MRTFKQKAKKFTAKFLLLTMTCQLVFPNVSLALATGPSQPEVQSFEPVGTTDMVDMFTGDFVYNIPLLDVEGYPVNIAYHAGIGMEQEASWVGLGWNINPGVINRSVRGIPDDFKGDQLVKQLNIKPEKTLRLEAGLGVELAGLGDPSLIAPSLSLTTCLNYNSYKGFSSDLILGGGVRVLGFVSAGVNVGIGTQSGTDVDYYGSLTLATPQSLGKMISGNVSITKGGGFNTLTGMKDQFKSVSFGTRVGGVGVNSPVFTSTIPIGVKNYVPVITNSSYMTTALVRIKAGLLFNNAYGWGAGKAMWSTLKFNNDGTRPSYGYLYMQDATANDILDFTRDKDGLFNRNMRHLPPGNMTYDVYSVLGQGTGGSFRPFRNDFGSVFDPTANADANSISVQAEAGFGVIFEFGLDFNLSKTDVKSGPWENYQRPFVGYDQNNENLYQPAFFKQGGELTAVDDNYWNQVGQTSALNSWQIGQLPLKRPNSDIKRDPKVNLVYYQTAKESDYNGVTTSKNIYSYTDTNGFALGPEPAKESISRYSASGEVNKRKSYHITEFTQIREDGRRYVYGLPAMNNIQREATYSIDAVPDNESTGLIAYDEGLDNTSNNKGVDNYFNSTITPAYAHSYFLTNVFSTDYVDITGDGPTDDDLGSYNKFNYTLKSDDYRWRSPIQADKVQYDRGYVSDKLDDKANYICGSREQWVLHSIESKNYVAEFYTSKRKDAKGVLTAIKDVSAYSSASGIEDKQYSYKLDSIKLYNKHDRFKNKAAAIPVKTVVFEYSYDLCKGLPNAESENDGKLTLKKIFIKYGDSYKSMLSPYQFTYNNLNPNYSHLNKDRWGNYKANGSVDFPYVDQTSNADGYAAAWSLSKITLPSGGIIDVEYEADDYSHVQQVPATEMFIIEGVGNSPYFSGGNQLYMSDKDPYLYIYFKKKNSSDNAASYQPAGLLYYSANIRIAGWSNEQVRGYVATGDYGDCPGNSNYGYIRLIGKKDGSRKDAVFNPITYTALNTARYNVPHILPGFEREIGSLMSFLKKVAKKMVKKVKDVFKLGKSPIANFVDDGLAREIECSKSYVRLTSPYGKKKGGGHRVKSLKMYDSWNDLAGGSAEEATYGKNYNYEMKENGRTISSGVASYEPLVGGDENPCRGPIPYRAQNGNNWPPLDAVDLYQEGPIGESFFPGPVVGYQQVTVSSIHKDVGKSSQAVDVYSFYTARSHPVSVQSSGLEMSGKTKYSLLKQENIVEVKEGFTITLNDMHGKPKSVENFVRKKAKGSNQEMLELIRKQVFHYNSTPDNQVDVLEYEGTGGGRFVKKKKRIGVDVDVTVDTRAKREHTSSFNFNFNLIFSNFLFFPTFLIVTYPWTANYKNEFYSAVSTKVVQKYGILSAVETYDNGATTVVSNDVFDGATGQPVITSVNNEFGDREYTTNYPAYWAYVGMGGAYANDGFELRFSGSSPSLNSKKEFTITMSGSQTSRFFPGDEVLVVYDNGSSSVLANFISQTGTALKFQLRDLSSFGGSSVSNISRIKVLKPGRKNQLTESVQTVTTLGLPFSNDVLLDSFSNVISITARKFSESDLLLDQPNASADYNPYSNGMKGLFRMSGEYAYNANRSYTAPARRAGLFSAPSKWKGGTSAALVPANSSINWKVVREVMKWTPFSTEIENVDALGNYSTAVYAYNEELPVAVAYNAKQGEAIAENFEDFGLLMPQNAQLRFHYSPFKSLFPINTASGVTGYHVFGQAVDTTITPPGDASPTDFHYKISGTASHTGKYSLLVEGNQNPPLKITLPVGAPVANKYSKMRLQPNSKYVLSCWIRPKNLPLTAWTHLTTANGNPNVLFTSTAMDKPTVNFSSIIDGWQRTEYVFNTGNSGSTVVLNLVGATSSGGNSGTYFDDFRIYPISANMKSYVYHPVTKKLMATLDENNYATFYEYDQEGNLIRTKRETEKGIITISESRSANPNTRAW